MRTMSEYRVQVQRTGNAIKEKRFRSLKSVARYIGLLTSPEPWKFYDGCEYADKKGSDYVCCSGDRYSECGCMGITFQEQTDEKRKDLPPIEWIRVHARQITTTSWEALESVTSADARLTPSEQGKATGSAVAKGFSS